jgi:hypothetical protein
LSSAGKPYEPLALVVTQDSSANVSQTPSPLVGLLSVSSPSSRKTIQPPMPGSLVSRTPLPLMSSNLWPAMKPWVGVAVAVGVPSSFSSSVGVGVAVTVGVVVIVGVLASGRADCRS